MPKLTTEILFTILLTVPAFAMSQTAGVDAWEGRWVAQGTLFQVGITINESVIAVNEVESLGFVWNSGEGQVNGNVARIPVQYAGVKGIVRVELVNANTAVAIAASCMPDFMVVCALARGRQAIFKRVQIE